MALTAVGLAALRATDNAWDGRLFGLTALTLLTAILLAVHRWSFRRAYWLGFALFGWEYLAMSLVPPIEARLMASKLLAYLDSQVLGRTGQVTFTVSLNNQPVPSCTSVAFSPSGTQATASQGSVRLWDATTGRLQFRLGGTTQVFMRRLAGTSSWFPTTTSDYYSPKASVCSARSATRRSSSGSTQI